MTAIADIASAFAAHAVKRRLAAGGILEIPSLGIALKARAGLDRIMAATIAALDELSDGINAGLLSPVEWHNSMADVLLTAHTAAYLEGRGVDSLSPGARRLVAEIVSEQVQYLNGFLDKVEAEGWQDARDRARAHLYAGALKATHARAEAFGLNLPAYPGDGSTECLTNCRCRWDIRWLDREELNADCYWRMGQAEHCDTCRSRAETWAPLKVRGGEVRDG
jgi:hypothetical protein